MSRCAVILIGSVLSFGAAHAIELDWFTVDGGGDYSAGGSFELEGTIGQPDAGTMSGGTFSLTGGFWSVAQAGPSAPGDCDADGDTDLDDYAAFTACLDGPGGGAEGGCECTDFDADGDADLADWAEFQIAFTAP